MSITFFAAQKINNHRGGEIVTSLFNCDCDQRYLAAHDKVELEWLRLRDVNPMCQDPEWPSPADYTCNICNHTMNLNNRNAHDLLDWIGLKFEECGSVSARDMAAKCRRRLWNEPRNYDIGIESTEENQLGHAKVVNCGRDPGYLRHKTEKLLEIADWAGDNLIAWG